MFVSSILPASRAEASTGHARRRACARHTALLTWRLDLLQLGRGAVTPDQPPRHAPVVWSPAPDALATPDLREVTARPAARKVPPMSSRIHVARSEMDRLRVLAPIGAAFLVLAVGDTISWPLPDRREARVRILAVEPSTPTAAETAA